MLLTYLYAAAAAVVEREKGVPPLTVERKEKGGGKVFSPRPHFPQNWKSSSAFPPSKARYLAQSAVRRVLLVAVIRRQQPNEQLKNICTTSSRTCSGARDAPTSTRGRPPLHVRLGLQNEFLTKLNGRATRTFCTITLHVFGATEDRPSAHSGRGQSDHICSKTVLVVCT